MTTDGFIIRVKSIGYAAGRLSSRCADIRRAIADGNANGLQMYLNMLDEDAEQIQNQMKLIVDEDEQSANRRWLLRGRIRRMVEKIETAEKIPGHKVHTAWLELGGSPQDVCTVYELERKVDWLYATYPHVFKRDTRDWKAPVELTGNEPMLPAKNRVGDF